MVDVRSTATSGAAIGLLGFVALGVLARAAFFGGATFLTGVRLATLLAEGFDLLEATLGNGFLAFALTFLTGAFFADMRLEARGDVFFATFFREADFTGFLAAPLALSAFLGATVLRLEATLRVGFLAI